MGIEFSQNGQEYFDNQKKINTKTPDFTITKVNPIFYPGVMLVGWQTVSAGFGELHIYEKDNKLVMDSEGMSIDFCKTVFSKLLEQCEII